MQGEMAEADRDEKPAVKLLAGGTGEVQSPQVMPLGDAVGTEVNCLVTGEFEQGSDGAWVGVGSGTAVDQADHFGVGRASAVGVVVLAKLFERLNSQRCGFAR